MNIPFTNIHPSVIILEELQSKGYDIDDIQEYLRDLDWICLRDFAFSYLNDFFNGKSALSFELAIILGSLQAMTPTRELIALSENYLTTQQAMLKQREELIQENDKLKRENISLRRELQRNTLY